MGRTYNQTHQSNRSNDAKFVLEEDQNLPFAWVPLGLAEDLPTSQARFPKSTALGGKNLSRV